MEALSDLINTLWSFPFTPQEWAQTPLAVQAYLLDGQLSKLSFFTQRPGTGNRDAFGNRGDIDAWKPSRVQGPRHWTSAR